MQWWATYPGTWRGIQAGGGDVSPEHLRIKPFVEWIQYRVCDNNVSFPLLYLALGLVRNLGRIATCQELTCGTADHTQLRLYLLQPVWLILDTWAYICGLVTIVFALFMDAVLQYSSGRFNRGTYSCLKWASTWNGRPASPGTLQRQRIAFRSVKSGTWFGSAGWISITSRGWRETMAELPFQYPVDQSLSEKQASESATEATAPS